MERRVTEQHRSRSPRHRLVSCRSCSQRESRRKRISSVQNAENAEEGDERGTIRAVNPRDDRPSLILIRI